MLIVENNKWAYSTPTAKQTANPRFVDRARAYGCYGEQVDGNDVLAVYEVTRRAVARARDGRGPDAHRGRHHAHARPRRARRHEVRAAARCSRSGRRKDPIAALRAPAARAAARRRQAELDAIVARHRRRAAGGPGLGGGQPHARSREPASRRLRRPRRSAAPIPPLVAEWERRKGRALMPVLTYLEAIRLAMLEEMEQDERVFVIGEDVGHLRRRVPRHRGLPRDVRRDARHRHARSASPPSWAPPSAPRSWACGPIAEMQFIDFISCGFDQIVNYAAKSRYRWGGGVPIVVRGPVRRRRARRALPQPEPRGLLHERAGAEDRGPGHARATPRA